MKKIILISLILMSQACSLKKTAVQTTVEEKSNINHILDQWHKDVATFDFEAYFDKMTADAVFVGTDAAEVWSKSEFMSFCKPYFDKKQTWDFKPLDRNVYLNTNKKTAWFDETLDTWMGVCRGSGVLVKVDKEWKIQHYVLSVAVPNADIKAIVKIKQKQDSLYIKKIRNLR